MKTKLFILFLINLICVFAIAGTPEKGGRKIEPQSTVSKMEEIKAKLKLDTSCFAFTENKGQIHDQNNVERRDILYSGFNGQMAYHFKKNGFSYQQYRVDSKKKFWDPKTRTSHDIPATQTIYRSDFEWIGSNENVMIDVQKVNSVINNYHLNEVQNINDVRNYEELVYHNLYEGVDVKWYHKDGQLKYDYLVAAGADYKQIKLKVSGLSGISVNIKGELVMQTPLGKIIEQAPLVQQAGQTLKSRWKLKKDIISLEIQNVDPSLPFVIDPVVRLWGTYYGGNNTEYCYSCTTDASGNVYLSGLSAASGTVIVTSGAYQTATPSFLNAFLVKFNSLGVRQWGTYFGGAGAEIPNNITYDNSGNIYMVGAAQSPTGVASVGAHQTVHGGGTYDAFIAKFTTGGAFVWATYCGGNNDDRANSCAVDGSGNVYIAGYSVSSDANVIGTPGSFGPTYTGPAAFFAKFNSSGVRQWGSFYQGCSEFFGCAVDGTGNLYLAGSVSYSFASATTSGSHQQTFGGSNDALLAKFDGSGARLWATYYGGGGDDFGYNCATDPSGNVYMTGSTNTSTGTVIASGGSFQSAFGSNSDAFLVKFNSSGVRQWGTYYGYSGSDIARSCVTDASSNIYISGETSNSLGFTSSGAYQSILGSNDAFVAKFDASGNRVWGVAYGGSDYDLGRSCAYDGSGNVYLCGTARSSSGFSSMGAHQTAYSGGPGVDDAFLVCFRDCAFGTPTITPVSSVCEGANLNLAGNVTSTIAVIYSWTGPNAFISAAQNPTIIGISTAGAGNYTLTVSDGLGCYQSASVSVVVDTSPTISVASGSICLGDTYNISPSGASTYTISGGSFAVSPATNSNYTITGTSAFGCPATNTAICTVTVAAIPSISVSATSTLLCGGNSTTLTASGASTYTWSGGPLTTSFVVSPTVNTTYTVNGTSALGCTNTAVKSVSIISSPTINISPSSSVICSGGSATLTGSGANTYTWSGGPSTASYAVSPTITTNYTLTGTAANGCTNTASQSVSVNITPTITITPSSTVICSGNMATFTAGGATTYTWSGGPSTAAYAISPTITTNYSVTGTSSGCTNTAVQSLSVNTTPTITISTTGSVICSGLNTTLTASGAASYTWNAGPSTASYAVNPTVSSNYTVIGTAANSCTNSSVQTVSVNTTPTLNITPSSTVICDGKSATLTAGGAGSYTWSGGPSTASYVVSPTVTTSYTVTGGSSGCTNTAVQSISVNTTPTVSITNTGTVICSGATTTLTGNGAASYAWVAGPATAAYAVSPGTTSNYTVIGTAANSCTNSAVQQVSVNATPVITITPSSTVICTGKSATLTASGANTYTWNTGPVTSSIVVSPSVTTVYTVTGTTAVSGCTNIAVRNISVNLTPTITISPSSTVLCLGKTALLTGLGGNSYTWTGGPTTDTYAITPTITTVYTVTGVTAASGCTNTAVQSMSVNALTAINISPAAPVICSGNTSTIVASGVTTYSWVSGPTTSSYAVTPSVTTTYSVTGNDAATGCTNIAMATVSVNTTPTLAVNSGSICSGNSFTIVPSGASTYTISGGTTTVSPMTTTSYTLTGTSAAGCVAMNTVVSTVSVYITPTVAVNSGSICTGFSFTMSPSGAATYTYSSGSNIVSPLTTTSYSVIGSSTAGCVSANTAISNVTVNITPTLVVNSGTLCTGRIFTMVPTGASTYTFSNGSATVSPLVTSSYSVTGTSAAGCLAGNTAVSTITVFITPTISATSGSICTGNNFTIVPSGASTYTISGSGAFVVSPTAFTSYSVIGTSTDGCVSANTATASVTPYLTPTISIVPTPSNGIICVGEYAWMIASGAGTYTWISGPANAAYTVNPISNTSYTVIGTSGSSGCTNTAVQNLTVNTTPTVTIVPSTTFVCSGNTTTLTASGTNSYTWTPTVSNFSSAVFSPSVTTVYTVIGTAANNCTAMAIQSVSVNLTPTLSIVPSNTVICSGRTATFTASGASSYLWNTSAATASISISPSVTTSYTVTGTTNSCSATAVQNLSVNATPVITISPSSTVLCSGKTLTLSSSGANTYTWNTSSTNASISISPSVNTTYTVNGTSAVGNCTNTAVQSISVNPTPTVSISPSSTVICTGKTATFTASGADTYSWNTSATGSILTLSPSSTTSYTVLGTNVPSGCTNTAVRTLSVNTTPSVSLVQTSTVICSGKSVTISLSGASTYSWSTGATNSTIIFNPTVSTNYTVIGFAANTCTNSAATSISVNTTPTIVVPSGSICAGDVFTISPSGASTYTISGGSTTVSPLSNTVYIVSGTASNGCVASNTPAVNIFVNQLPLTAVNGGSICIGNSFTLNASGANTYTWDSGANTSSIVVSPSVPTVYTVTGASAANCIKSVTTSVVALVIPNVSISGNTAVCIGSALTLTANGATNFTWSPGAQTSSVIVVSPTVNTTYTVRGVLGSNSCSNTASQLITINPKPILSISGNTFVCPGSPLILTANGAATYTWVGGIVSNTLNVTPTVSTTYSVSGTDNNGCSNTSSFMVKTASMITPSICLVTVDSLSVNNEIYWDKHLFPRADTFLVYREYIATQYKVIARIPKSALSMYIDTNRSIGPNIGNPNHSSYKYKLQYKDSCGNLSAMSPYHKTIKVDDYQSGNFSWNYYNIDGIDYQAANYYLWRYHVITGSLTLLGGTSGSSFTDPLYASIAVTGNYKWYVTTSGFNCNPSQKPSATAAGKTGTKSNNSNERQFPTPEGVNETLLAENSFVIYPNPANERFVLNSEIIEDYEVELTDLLGRTINVPMVKERTSTVFEIGELKQGLYLIRISRGKEQLVKKVIVE